MNYDCIKLIEILGRENADRVRSAITDALIENIISSLEESYLIDSDTISNQMEELVKECFDAAREKYMNVISEAMEQKLEECLRNLKGTDNG